jgi:outer membrane protein OmpA-like peptidoglycan-associated protein
MRFAMPRPGRPLWLITLADLSLLLVGFFVFLQATAHKEQKQQAAIQAGIRQAFGGEPEPRLAVDANLIGGFGTGSAELPSGSAQVVAWSRDALADPRTRLLVTGYADGSIEDRHQGSALALAALRADAVAANLSVPTDRVRIDASVAPGARRVTLTISYDP